MLSSTSDRIEGLKKELIRLENQLKTNEEKRSDIAVHLDVLKQGILSREKRNNNPKCNKSRVTAMSIDSEMIDVLTSTYNLFDLMLTQIDELTTKVDEIVSPPATIDTVEKLKIFSKLQNWCKQNVSRHVKGYSKENNKVALTLLDKNRQMCNIFDSNIFNNNEILATTFTPPKMNDMFECRFTNNTNYYRIYEDDSYKVFCIIECKERTSYVNLTEFVEKLKVSIGKIYQ